MVCQQCTTSTLYSSNVNSQTLEAGNTVAIGNVAQTGCSIVNNSGVISLAKPGAYFVTVNADVKSTVSGSVSLQLYNGSEAVAGAEATTSVTASSTTTTGTVSNVGFSTIIKVPKSCCMVDNSANLSVKVNAIATVTNFAVSIFKM